VQPDAAVLVLDLQRDFLEDAGRMPIARSQVTPLLAGANAVIDAAAARGTPVVYVLNEFPRSQFVLNFFRRGAAVAGTPGAELDPRVHVSGNVRIPKEASDAFTNPSLDPWLREHGVKSIILLGVFAPHCVRATCAGALRRGYRVTVVGDAVAAATDAARDRAVEKMRAGGASVVDAATIT
jgi:nicotinamidase-related amidase